jgi:hypothetical protein
MSDRTDIAKKVAAAESAAESISGADMWAQGGYVEHSDKDDKSFMRYCMLSAFAIRMARMPHENLDDLAQFLGFKDEEEAIQWNDDENRTQAEVVLRLQKAAQRGGLTCDS